MKYSDYNDYELIYLVRENDNSSYDILFNKYMPIMKRLAYEYYKNFNSFGYDLDDFVQEAYLSFYKSLDVYDPDKDCLFYTFVVMCINRGLTTFCKRISCCKKNISNSFLVDIDLVEVCGDVLDGSYLSLNEFIKKIWDVVYNYDILYISVFELRFNGFTFKEIGELLDIPLKKAQFIYRKVNNYIRNSIEFCV